MKSYQSIRVVKELFLVFESRIASNLHSFYWPAGGNSTGFKKSSDCSTVTEKLLPPHLMY